MAKMILFQNNLNKSLILTHLLKEIMIGLKKNNINSNIVVDKSYESIDLLFDMTKNINKTEIDTDYSKTTNIIPKNGDMITINKGKE